MPSGNYSNTFVITATANPQIIQDWEGCGSLKEHQVVHLLDTRDNNVYTVAKLKDNKCWMTENLRLGDEKLIDRTLTPDNTNITSNYTLPESSESGFEDNITENLYVGAPKDDYTSGYYTWLAATAGTGKPLTTQGQNATGSICPKGWRLPTGGSGGEFEVLAKQYGSGTDEATSVALIGDPVNFVLTGTYTKSSFDPGGNRGQYWSSTTYTSTVAYYLYISTGSVAPENINGRGVGNSVRCISQENIEYNITFNDNSGSGGPGSQTGSIKDSFIKLDSTKPNRSGYEFKGWCTTETSDETCSVKTYQPGDDYDILDNRNSATLYAMWKMETGPGSCPKPVTTCSYNGVSGKRYGNSPCYQSSDATTYTVWSSASSYCPSGWSLPSQSDFNNLVSSSQAGSGACLYEQGWNLNGYRYGGSVYGQGSYGIYWSSTPYGSNAAYYLGLNSSSAYVGNSSTYDEYSVRCLHQ